MNPMRNEPRGAGLEARNISAGRNEIDGAAQFRARGSGAPTRLQLPVFTQEESIVLRALVAGKNKKRICAHMRMDAGDFYRVLRDLRTKTGARDVSGLVIWALQNANTGDRRGEDRNYRYIQPPLLQQA